MLPGQQSAPYLHDALPIYSCAGDLTGSITRSGSVDVNRPGTYPLTYSAGDGFNTATATRTIVVVDTTPPAITPPRSEEHTSELQSQSNLVCRLLLEKKKAT